MSRKMLDKILTMCDNIDRNRPIVEQRMRDAGFQPDPILVDSMAKYWQTLERLAAE